MWSHLLLKITSLKICYIFNTAVASGLEYLVNVILVFNVIMPLYSSLVCHSCELLFHPTVSLPQT